jgi:hypothetical protein
MRFDVHFMRKHIAGLMRRGIDQFIFNAISLKKMNQAGLNVFDHGTVDMSQCASMQTDGTNLTS